MFQHRRVEGGGSETQTRKWISTQDAHELVESIQGTKLLAVNELDSIHKRIHEVIVLCSRKGEAFGDQLLFAGNIFVDPDLAIHEIRDCIVSARLCSGGDPNKIP